MTVTVNPPPTPTVDIKANGSNGPITLSYNTAATLSWSSSNTSSCTASGDWSGSKILNTPPTESTGNLTSSRTYTLTCNGVGGSVSDTVTVNVSAPPPIDMDLRVNGENHGTSQDALTVTPGQTVYFTWSSSGRASRYCRTFNGNSGWAQPSVPVSYGDSNQWQQTGLQFTAPSALGTYEYSAICEQDDSFGLRKLEKNILSFLRIHFAFAAIVSDSDSVFVQVSAQSPNNPTNVTVTPPDYCISGPAATIGWTYSDPAGSPQTAYEVQMDEQGSFSDPEYQTGKVMSNSNSNFTGQGILLFGKTYKTRVRVWNSYDKVSGWTVASGNFNTPAYAYPQVDFSWTANGVLNNPSPPVNKPVTFTDLTVFYGNPNGRQWNWSFGDSGSSTTQNPSHTYSTEGTYYVTLTATDNANQFCSKTKGPLIIQKPIPKWREIAPR